MNRSTFVLVVLFFGFLVFSPPAGAHAYWNHPDCSAEPPEMELYCESLVAPLLHTITYYVRQTDRIRDNKCLSPLVRQYVPIWTTPINLRRYRMKVEWSRLVAARNATNSCTPWYVTKQIRVANLIGAAATIDPWPNCPDPFFGGGSWYDTVACENRAYHELYGYPREFLDSPGPYRCGLQFDPSWERKYGQLCPW